MPFTPVIIFNSTLRAANSKTFMGIESVLPPTRDIYVGQDVILYEPESNLMCPAVINSYREHVGVIYVKLCWKNLRRVNDR